MRRRAIELDRSDLLRALPKHIWWALVCGAVASPLLFSLLKIPLEGWWYNLLYLPAVIIYSVAVMFPLVKPGRHWTFGFLGAVLLPLLLLPAGIVSSRVAFSHARVMEGEAPISLVTYVDGRPAPRPIGKPTKTAITQVNAITGYSLATGAAFGLFYGLLSGRMSAMLTGLLIGSVSGYLLGIASRGLFTLETKFTDDQLWTNGSWKYDGPIHMVWQGALALAFLHLMACIGAAFGAGKKQPSGGPPQRGG